MRVGVGKLVASVYTWGYRRESLCLIAVITRTNRRASVYGHVARSWRGGTVGMMDATQRAGSRIHVRWRSLPFFFAGLIGWLIFFALMGLALIWLSAPSNPLGVEGWVACSLSSGVATFLAGWLAVLTMVMGLRRRGGRRHQTASAGVVWWCLFAVLELSASLLFGMLTLLLRPNAPPLYLAFLTEGAALLFLPIGGDHRARLAGEEYPEPGRASGMPLIILVFVLIGVLLPEWLWNRLHRTQPAIAPRRARSIRFHIPRPLLILPLFAALLAVTVSTIGLLVIEAPGIFPTYTLNTRDITYTLAWSPDGQYVASADEERNQLIVWDATFHRAALRLVCPYIHQGVSWSWDSSLLVTACGNIVTVWDARTGAVVRTIDGGQSALDYAWSPASDTLALLTDNNGSSHSTIQLWNVAKDTQFATFPLSSVADQIAWSPDGLWLAVAEKYGVRILAAETGETEQYLTDGNEVTNIAWAPDSTRLLMATWLPGDASVPFFLPSPPDRSVSVWDVTDATETLVVPEQPAADFSIAWSPTGQTFAVADDSIDGAAQVYAAGNGQVRFVIRGQRQISALAWSPDGQTIATSEFDGMIAFWHPEL